MTPPEGNAETWDENRKYILVELKRVGGRMDSFEENQRELTTLVTQKYESIIQEIQAIRERQVANDAKIKFVVGGVSATVTALLTGIIQVVLLIVKKIASTGG